MLWHLLPMDTSVSHCSLSHHLCFSSFPGEGRRPVSFPLPLGHECCWILQSSSCVISFAPFSHHHHFIIFCITKILIVAKGAFIIQNGNLSCGPLRIDIECTLTWDCVGCVLSQKIACIPSIRMSCFHTVSFALPVFSRFVHTVAPSLGLPKLGVCISGFQKKIFFFTLYLWTFQSCRIWVQIIFGGMLETIRSYGTVRSDRSQS